MISVLSDTCTSIVCVDHFLALRDDFKCLYHMFVDQFSQTVDLYSSPNSRRVIKTEYKEIEKEVSREKARTSRHRVLRYVAVSLDTETKDTATYS